MMDKITIKKVKRTIHKLLKKTDRQFMGIKYFQDDSEINLIFFNIDHEYNIQKVIEYNYNDSVIAIANIAKSVGGMIRISLGTVAKADAMLRILNLAVKQKKGVDNFSGFAFNSNNSYFISLDECEILESPKVSEIVDFKSILIDIANMDVS